jgi:hypothetical protein
VPAVFAHFSLIIIMRQLSFIIAFIAVASGSTACYGPADAASAHVDSLRADSIARARQDSVNRSLPGYVVDSARPIPEEIRRFAARIGGDPVSAFAHASASREALIRRVVRDVVESDSTDLSAAAITPREFIDLIYPSSPYTHPPYEQPPDLVWMQIANPSAAGYRRLLARRGGQAFAYIGHGCASKAERQGPNTLFVDCVITVRDPSRAEIKQRWFGSIIERDGRFKILSYRNQF